MGWKDSPVSAELGMLIIGALALAGVIVGLIPGNGAAVALIALLFIGWGSYIRADRMPNNSELDIVLLLGLFACLATALVTTGLRLFVTTPGLPLLTFWLYAIVAAGFMVSRCCLGWHVGAAAAVLTSFLAVGFWVQSFYGGGREWLGLLIFSAALWWGADSWRHANGLALNE